MSNLRKLHEKINIPCSCTTGEPLREHTTFRIGGPADYYCTPESKEELTGLISFAREKGIPLFFLGEGANILVSDRGYRGIVADLTRFDGMDVDENGALTARTGAKVSDIARFAADKGLTGAEFLYAMPGTVGGAVYMNARCYGVSVADILTRVLYIDEKCVVSEFSPGKSDFNYKKSPFMEYPWTIIEATFQLTPGNRWDIRKKMEANKTDRERKGHFAHPSAGSVFKNNREFGEPTGKLVDNLGLRGYRIGDAQVSPVHGNIIINTGNAAADDVRNLIEYVKKRVRDAYGFDLEEEVRFIGEW